MTDEELDDFVTWCGIAEDWRPELRSLIAEVRASREPSRRAGPDREKMAALHIVFDGFPGPEGPRFVEVETPDGKSINAGEWRQRDDGFTELIIRQGAFGAVPAGHALVPLVPTEAMLAPYRGLYRTRISPTTARGIWAAMIAAALSDPRTMARDDAAGENGGAG